MIQATPLSRRRRWPLVLLVVVVLAAGSWATGWYIAAGITERTIAAWQAREARAGRVYSCAAQTIGGFPFGIKVRCADAGANLTTFRPRLRAAAKDLLISAEILQPTTLTTELIGPLTVAAPGQSAGVSANWQRAQTKVRGLPTSPQSVSIEIDEPVVDRQPDGKGLFGAKRLALNGRIVAGTAQDHPVIEVVVKLVSAVAPGWHPAAAVPIDADVTAVLRGLADFSPKPWPERFRELQAAGGRIDIKAARIRQGETVAVANGALGLSPRGGLDGQLRLTVANLEKALPALGLDRMLAPETASPQLNRAFGALDRIMPGLGDVARQNAGPALVAGLNIMGEPTELEGKQAVSLPLRFSDGAVSLGPVLIGTVPPLF